MVSAPQPAGHHRITFCDVPVDGFWSNSVYNRDGFFEHNEFDSYTMNDVTADPDENASVTIDLSPTTDGFRNHLYVMDGWNDAIRLYRPRPAILGGDWVTPRPELVE